MTRRSAKASRYGLGLVAVCLVVSLAATLGFPGLAVAIVIPVFTLWEPVSIATPAPVAAPPFAPLALSLLAAAGLRAPPATSAA
jgi:hypothetical protein